MSLFPREQLNVEELPERSLPKCESFVNRAYNTVDCPSIAYEHGHVFAAESRRSDCAMQ
jgi:hypothetical protein